MRVTLACLAFVACVPLAATAPLPVQKKNLLVNGGFEDGPSVLKDGPSVGNFLSLKPEDNSVKGWVVTRGQIDLVGNYWPAAEGSRSIDLHGSPGLGGIKQTFKTEPRAAYVVTFSFAANPEGNIPKKRLAVSAAGRTKEFTADATGKTVKDLGWERKTWKFTADGKETTLEFHTLMKDDEPCGPVIDDVCVLKAD